MYSSLDSWGFLIMIRTFSVPAKKYLDIPGKVLTLVLVLAISIFQSTAAANTLVLDDDEAETSSTGRYRHWGKTDPRHRGSSLRTSRSSATDSHTGGPKHRTSESKHHTGGPKHRTS